MKTLKLLTMEHDSKEQKGFTLVELMVVVAISTIIMIGVSSVLMVGSSQAQSIGTKMIIQDSARNGMYRMLQELRETAPSKITREADAITFQVPVSVTDAGTITWSGDILYQVGGLNNAQLIRTDATGNSTVLANDVQTFEVTVNDVSNPTVINLRLDVQRTTVRGHTYTDSMTGEVKVRNE